MDRNCYHSVNGNVEVKKQYANNKENAARASLKSLRKSLRRRKRQKKKRNMEETYTKMCLKRINKKLKG